MMYEKKIYRRAFLKLAGGMLGAAISSRPWLLWAQQVQRLSIATGPTGGVFYVFGGVMANILTKNLTNVTVTAEVSAGGVDNGKLLGAQKVDLAMFAVDNAYEAYMGLEKFDKKIPVRTLLVMYPNYMHFVTLEGTGINSIRDIRGKRVSLGPPGSGTELKGIKVCEVYGIDYRKDIKLDRLGVPEAPNALKDGKIDAFYYLAGIPTGAILDLAATPGTKIKLLDMKEAISKLREKFGPMYGYSGVIPKGTYHGIDYDMIVPIVGNVLCCLGKMDEGLAYQITKTILENRNDLVLAHSEGKNITLENAVIGSPIPYHPGALRYYKEKGMTIK